MVWYNVSTGIESTRVQRKPFSAILDDEKRIEFISKYSIKFFNSITRDRDNYFLEKIV